VSFIATGPVAELIGASQTLVLAGVVGGVIFTAFLFLPGLREREPSTPVALSRQVADVPRPSGGEAGEAG
jgi:hypothetical protein